MKPISPEMMDDLQETKLCTLAGAVKFYNCDRTKCRCGIGSKMIAMAAVMLDYVTDIPTAAAFAEATIVGTHYMSNDKTPEANLGFMALMVCEAFRKAGILAEDEILAACQAFREGHDSILETMQRHHQAASGRDH